ncbi:MAG: DUF4837 family protein [Rikenellaceae bacterium]
MKRISLIFLSVVALIAVVSCDALHTAADNKVNSQGAPYELIIVCDQPEWEGALGDTLRSVFTAEIPYLTQKEPIFDVLRVTERGFTNLVTRHRNIFKTLIVPTIDSASVVVQYDLTASPQIVLTLQGGSQEAITKCLSENRAQIVAALEGAERDRAIEYAQKFNVKSLETLIKEKFLFDMKVPAGYTLRNDGDNFLWMSYEYPTASQGVVIYSYPAVDGVKSLNEADLLAARNKFVSKIPGPVEGSYMTTFDEYTPDYRIYRLGGRIWAEMRGLWEVEGDFMGGPFVSYSTLNTQTGEIVTIDCYVFSPKLGKRNFMRGVEHLIHNVSFPKPE